MLVNILSNTFVYVKRKSMGTESKLTLVSNTENFCMCELHTGDHPPVTTNTYLFVKTLE